MEKVFIEIALILLSTKIGGMLAKKVKMPEVLGALVAGVIIGPVCFNLVAYDTGIQLLSDIGVILLMFLAGLETDLKEFKKAGLSAFAIAVGGIIVPLVFGTLSAFLFYSNFWENIFIGVILTATSVSITVETLNELGKLNTRPGINILGAAVIDDILGLIVISIILALSGKGAAESSPSLGVTLIKIAVFIAIFIAAIFFVPKLLNKYLKDKKPTRTFLTLAIAAAFVASFFAEKMGIAAITGSYLCGLMLSSFFHKEKIQKGLKSISSGFLAPVFFASVGLEATLDGFSWRTLLIAVTMLVIAIFGKIIGCGFVAKLFKMSNAEAIQIGVGMVSRGEVAIITANIGLQAGIISNEVFVPTIIVVILTTVVTPVLLKLAFSHKHIKRIENT